MCHFRHKIYRFIWFIVTGDQLSKSDLLDLAYVSKDFEHLYMLPGDHPTDPWKLDFFINPPETEPTWVNIAKSNFTKQEVDNHLIDRYDLELDLIYFFHKFLSIKLLGINHIHAMLLSYRLDTSLFLQIKGLVSAVVTFILQCHTLLTSWIQEPG